MIFKTPYVLHLFGEEVSRRLSNRSGWLTAGVATSIPWPSFDVCVLYASDEYFLRGTEQNGKKSPPCITIASPADKVDEALSKIYRFTSILTWFLSGYVDVSGYVYGGVYLIIMSPSKNIWSESIVPIEAGMNSIDMSLRKQSPLLPNEISRDYFWAMACR